MKCTEKRINLLSKTISSKIETYEMVDYLINRSWIINDY